MTSDRSQAASAASTLPSRRTPTASPSPYLTPREAEVMDLLADGLSREQIAQRIGMSPETVKHHLRHAREKYDAPSTLVAIGRHTVARYQRAQATAA